MVAILGYLRLLNYMPGDPAAGLATCTVECARESSFSARGRRNQESVYVSCARTARRWDMQRDRFVREGAV
jgi:hypothetical protein